MDLLQVKGKHIVDGSGRPVHLRGVCFGGWLNMENFIAGYLGTEDNLRQVVRRELGEERYHAFFEGFRDAFIGPDDFAFLRRIGVTAVRIPFNYRMFESDMNPGTYDERGFHHLDRAIAAAREAGIYVILDLHAAPDGRTNTGTRTTPTASRCCGTTGIIRSGGVSSGDTSRGTIAGSPPSRDTIS